MCIHQSWLSNCRTTTNICMTNNDFNLNSETISKKIVEFDYFQFEGVFVIMSIGQSKLRFCLSVRKALRTFHFVGQTIRHHQWRNEQNVSDYKTDRNISFILQSQFLLNCQIWNVYDAQTSLVYDIKPLKFAYKFNFEMSSSVEYYILKPSLHGNYCFHI